ncbi:MAG TPA: TIGR03557 family F420-dependent LLM class oxidoreductase [Mycobacteriales bacterium]|nr:TIGR03557 family F420-dependent LLM class oxidoreductase [Mycobacteriales bacterium]
MATIGYFLSSEEHPGSELVKGAVLAERAGFPAAWISDHYHPWLDDQGHSPFVWSVLGAIAASTQRLRVTTAVTAPTVRIHPAVIAQAAASTAELFGEIDGRGRFALGVGSGEALNEHILGDHWPIPEVRLAMLEEAVAIIRELWKGEMVDHDGEHYVVENARLYTLPSRTPDVLVSGFGPKSIEVAARIGDGFITTSPSAEDIADYRRHGGRGPTQAGVKVCWHEDKQQAVKIAHHTWRNSFVPGQLAQDLPTPTHFEQASQLVTEEMVAEKVACGPDPEEHVASIRQYLDAGFDEVYVSQMGPDQEGMIRFYEKEVLPRLTG